MQRQKTFQSDFSKLYLVATPIGNLEDITFRAINTLNSVDYIYAEDTRTSKKLLNHYKIETKLRSYHLFNENEVTIEIIKQIKEGKNIAIISDAGSPSISDPGWLAVHEAIKANIDVVVIPGVSAVITGLIGSGIFSQNFYFANFLSHKKTKKQEELLAISKRLETVIIYESPHRIVSTLEIINDIMPKRFIVIARELTKIHEEYLRGTAAMILELAEELKGEMVIIIEGNHEDEENQPLNKLSIQEHFQYYLNQQITAKDALKKVSLDRRIPKSEVYQIIFGKRQMR